MAKLSSNSKWISKNAAKFTAISPLPKSKKKKLPIFRIFRENDSRKNNNHSIYQSIDPQCFMLGIFYLFKPFAKTAGLTKRVA